MVNAVYKVTDIVQIAGNADKLHFVFGITECFKDMRRIFAHHCDMRKRMLRESERKQGFVRTNDVGSDRSILPQLFICYRRHKNLPLIFG